MKLRQLIENNWKNLWRYGGLLALIVLGLGIPSTASAQNVSGYPAFNIDSWVTNPEALQYDSEFVLTLTFTNVGTFGANEVLVEIGDSNVFTGLGTSPRFNEMGIGAQVSTSIRVGIADDIESGYYDIPVDFTYHHSALGGTRQTDPRTIGVYVTGEPDEVSVSPNLIIEGSQISPGTDGEMLVDLTLHNVGTGTAYDVIVNMDTSEVFSPAAGHSSAFVIEQSIGVDAVETLTIPMVIVSDPGGQVNQSFTLEYYDYDGASYSDTQNVPILLSGSTTQSPYLLVQGYEVSPLPIIPGADIRLTLDIHNLGQGPAKDVFIRLGEDISSLEPLAPVGSSNVLYIEEVPAQSQVQIGFDLKVDGSASAGLVPIDVLLTYDNLYSLETSETYSISLQVESTPQFYIYLFEDVPEPIQVGDSFEVPVQIVNIGQNTVNINTVVIKSDILQISDGQIYMGALDSGTSGSVLAQADASQPGTATVVVEINYLDDYQQPQVYTHLFTFEIKDGGQPTNPNSGEAGVDGPAFGEMGGGGPMSGPGATEEMTLGQRIWQGILGFFGLAARQMGGGRL